VGVWLFFVVVTMVSQNSALHWTGCDAV